MKHLLYIIYIVLLLLPSLNCQSQELSDYTPEAVQAYTGESEEYHHRPRIAVVLAGGGAKGIAHVSVLKAIEDAGLPVDLVVGTSIGSIVGGMYCTGYSPDTMRNIIRSTDWIKMITDNPDFGNNRLSSKKNLENYILSISLDPTRLSSGTGLGGILQGRNVVQFFRDLTRFLPDSLDFDDMPIPFACVGTNAIDGTCKVFRSGNVPLAMRASMAIPTAFTPVTIDSIVYVDGFVVDNFPVDVARQLGADIVIAADLVTQTSNEQLTNSAVDMLMHCIDLYSKDRYAQNIADADVYIPIDVTGYNAASFTPDALDSLMARGAYYSSLKRASLDSLRQTLHLTEEPIRIRIGDYTFAKGGTWGHKEEDDSNYALYRANDNALGSTLRVGVRFDNYEMASLTAKANLLLRKHQRSLLSLEGRLGSRIMGRVSYSQRTFGTQRLGFYYKYQIHDNKFYNSGTKAIDAKTQLHKFNIYFTQEGRRTKYTFGLNYNIFDYNDITFGSSLITKMEQWPRHKIERFFSYFVKAEINTLDWQYLPTRGHQLEVSADLITDNLFTYQHKSLFPIFSGNWKWAIPCGEHVTVQPHVAARIMVTEDRDEPLSLLNMVGGLFGGQYYLQQQPMAGVNRLELVSTDGLGVAGITWQGTLFKDQYLVVTGDVMTHTNHIQNALDSSALNWGIEAGYHYRSQFGPIGIKFGWSNLSKQLGVLLNVGYYF